MNAIEFVRKFGSCEARSVLLKSKYHYEVDVYLVDTKEFTYIAIQPSENDPFVSLNDLKQIVDAFELAEKYKNRHGGIRFRIRWGMFRYGDTQEFNDRLKQAINLVEQCNA